MTSDRVINNRYQLSRHLGNGGMGSVWLADDRLLRRTVALKELLPQLGAIELPERRKRAIIEARAMAVVNHPSIVHIYDVFTVDDDPWIVMEYIDGRSLYDIIKDEWLDERAIAKIALPVLDGLQAAHSVGVIHRDVKPTNILVTDKDRAVFLVDFGIAKIDGDITITRYPGGAPGTVDYVAPERLQGQEASPAADMWSLGVTLFFALEGYSPFLRKGEAAREATRWAILTEDPPRLTARGRLADLTIRLLHKEPHQRATAAEAAQVLQSIIDGPPVLPRFSEQPPTVKVPANKPPPALQPRRADNAPDQSKLHDAREAIKRAGPEMGAEMLLAMPTERAAQVLAGLRSRESGALIQAISATRPAVAGEILKILSSSGAGNAVEYISASASASILAGMHPSQAARILSRTDPRTGAQIVMALAQSRSVELLMAMPTRQAGSMLNYVWPRTVADLFSASDLLRRKLEAHLDSALATQVRRYL
jgi:serine/threonine protein kinase